MPKRNLKNLFWDEQEKVLLSKWQIYRTPPDALWERMLQSEGKNRSEHSTVTVPFPGIAAFAGNYVTWSLCLIKATALWKWEKNLIRTKLVFLPDIAKQQADLGAVSSCLITFYHKNDILCDFFFQNEHWKHFHTHTFAKQRSCLIPWQSSWLPVIFLSLVKTSRFKLWV